MPSAITSFAVQNATLLDVDGEGYGINGNGWIVKAVLPFLAGQTFDPSKITITLEDPGFDATGAATTRTRVVRGTELVRRQFPNNTSRLGGQNGSDFEAFFAVSDTIFSGTTILSVDCAAGYYGASEAGAVTAGAISNLSTRAYPKPLFAWLNIQHERATGSSFPVEAVAYHKFGMFGRMVACIQFIARDAQATPNVAATQTAAAPSLSSFQTQGNIVEAYKASIPLAALAQGDVCQVNARVFPWIGDAASVLDLDTDGIAWPTARPATRLRFLNDKTGAYGGAIACVRATATGGTVQADLATARTTPFPTINAALTAVAAFNNANKGHNDHGGATIYIMDDGAGGAVAHALIANIAVALGTTALCWTEIRADPANTAAATITHGTNRTVCRLLRWRVSITVIASASFDGGNNNGNVMAAFEDGAITHTAGSQPLNYRCGLTYLRNLTTSFTSGNQSIYAGFGTTRTQAALILGCLNVGSVAGQAAKPWAIIGTFGVGVSEVDPVALPNLDINDGAVIVNNALLRKSADTEFAASQAYVAGIAFVQNVHERSTVGSAPNLQFGADSTVRPMDNILEFYNSIVGERGNECYNDVNAAKGVAKKLFAKFNIWDNINSKADVFTHPTDGQSSGRVGAFERLYSVGCEGNVSLTGSAGGSTPEVNGGSWLGMSWPNASYNVGRAAVGFTDPKANNYPNAGDLGAGGGTYSLTGTTNAAYNQVPAGGAMLGFDIAGVARRNDGTGAAGAYERTDASPGSGSASPTFAPFTTISAAALALAAAGSLAFAPMTSLSAGNLAAPGSGTGTVTVTLAAMSSSSAGALALAGVAAPGFAPLTSLSAGNLAVPGAGAGAAVITFSAMTGAAAADLALAASAALSFAPMTGIAAGIDDLVLPSIVVSTLITGNPNRDFPTPQNFSLFAGDAKTLKVTVFDEDGDPIPLAGVQAVTWRLARTARSVPVLTKTMGAGVTVIADDADEGGANCGRLDVVIESADSDPLDGEYVHECQIVDASGARSAIFYGRANVAPSLN